MANIPKNIIEILIKYIKDLSKEIEIDKVIIFGSYAKNCYNKDSDIDIAIFSKNFTDSTKIEDIFSTYKNFWIRSRYSTSTFYS